VHSLQVNEGTQEIGGVLAVDGELLAFQKPLLLKGEIEHCLSVVQEGLHEAVFKAMKRSKVEYETLELAA